MTGTSDGKVLFITGAGSGIGAAVARHAVRDGWREMILTNVLGTALTARATLTHLLKSKGHLLLLGSVTGRVATPGPYSATKFAVGGMAKSISQEVRGRGVRVTNIEPGRVDTAYWDADGKPEGVDYLKDDDIAHAVLYALNQPPHVAISEVVIRPTAQVE